MKKRRKNEDMEYISPNNLIVPSWWWPVPKKSKMISIASVIVFVICVAFIIAYEEIESSSPAIEFLWFVFTIATPLSFFLSFTAPAEFLLNKILRKIKNEEAEEEMRAREEEERKEMLDEETNE